MKNVLITGASRGIGAECARQFAQNGYRVFINYNCSEKAALELCRELVEKGYVAHAIKGDVSQPEKVREMFSVINGICPGIDILVNNAGIAQTRLFTDITDQDWERMISVNLSSVFYCCREALRHMINNKWGRIINISSMWGQVGGSCEVHYSAAKAGIIGLTKALAMEEGPSGITVNCIAPGVIATDMLSGYSETDLSALREETPAGRLGKPADIAGTALFLADEASSFITGQVIGVSGGFVM